MDMGRKNETIEITTQQRKQVPTRYEKPLDLYRVSSLHNFIPDK